MAKDAEDKERIKAERLRDALRANLRRRKVKPGKAQANTVENVDNSDDPDTIT